MQENYEQDKFIHNYKMLKQSVDKLRISDVSDIDSLMETVGEISRAHQACSQRLQAIRGMLDEHLSEVEE